MLGVLHRAHFGNHFVKIQNNSIYNFRKLKTPMGFKKSHIYKVLAKKSKFESIITHWTRIINKSLENLRKWSWKRYIWEKPTKKGHILWQVLQNNPVSQDTSPSLTPCVGVLHVLHNFPTVLPTSSALFLNTVPKSRS